MSSAALLAGGAGACAGYAGAELVALVRARRPRTGQRSGGAPTGEPPLPGRRWVGVLARLGRRAAGRAGSPQDLTGRIDAAGLPARIAASDVMAVKAGAALAGLALAIVLAPVLPGRLGWLGLFVTPAGAFLAPDAWLARRARGRRARMTGEAADLLDLLRVAVAAGLPVGRALGEVGRRQSGLMAAELASASALLELGAPRDQALARFARRCPLPAAASLVVAVARSGRHGSPLGPALSALAADARAEHARRLQDRAAKAGPKIQLVVALLLVPAVMLLVAAALLATLAPGA
ncbi:MAG: tight adherence protein [Solirubrobacteraceae bacterium]|nr:tight adherence protein [Solirubrobacteraceae bacterium]